LVGSESGITRSQRDGRATGVSALVGEDTDDLKASVTLAHGDCRRIRVDWEGFVENITRVLEDGLVADLVYGSDETVKCRGGVIAGRPDGFAVEGDAATVKILLLTFVNWIVLLVCFGTLGVGKGDGPIGIPSWSMAKAMAFLFKEISEVRDGKRGLSWFSRKDPRRVVSAQRLFIVLMPFTRLLILPLVDWKAWVIQK
jgi:hypothetical protein